MQEFKIRVYRDRARKTNVQETTVITLWAKNQKEANRTAIKIADAEGHTCDWQRVEEGCWESEETFDFNVDIEHLP